MKTRIYATPAVKGLTVLEHSYPFLFTQIHYYSPEDVKCWRNSHFKVKKNNILNYNI